MHIRYERINLLRWGLSLVEVSSKQKQNFAAGVEKQKLGKSQGRFQKSCHDLFLLREMHYSHHCLLPQPQCRKLPSTVTIYKTLLECLSALHNHNQSSKWQDSLNSSSGDSRNLHWRQPVIGRDGEKCNEAVGVPFP